MRGGCWIGPPIFEIRWSELEICPELRLLGLFRGGGHPQRAIAASRQLPRAPKRARDGLRAVALLVGVFPRNPVASCGATAPAAARTEILAVDEGANYDCGSPGAASRIPKLVE